jgi:electron transport complex protein RnfB
MLPARCSSWPASPSCSARCTLGYASIRFKVKGDPLVDKIDAILPQTQCGQCGFPGLQALCRGDRQGRGRNQPVPARRRGRHPQAGRSARQGVQAARSAEHGTEKPKRVAFIDEAACIGCTLCTQACPVDAIVGAAKQMHTIVAPLCTGCELCVSPCPVDCIAMVPVPETVETWKWKYPVVKLTLAEPA